MLGKNSFSLIGPIAEETLQRLNADILFLGADGFDVPFGLSTPNLPEAKGNRAMVGIARQVIVVRGSSKFGRSSPSLIASTSVMHQVIAEPQVPQSDCGLLKERV